MNIQTIKAGIDNCYIIKDKSTIIVDAGMPGYFRKLKSGLKQKNINPQDIEAMVITHCHWDHIGCAKLIKNITGAKVIVHKNERERLENGGVYMPPGVTRWGKFFGSFLNHWIKRVKILPCEVDVVVDDDYALNELGINGKIVHTPGHSPGSVSIVLDSGEAFVGDLAMDGFPLSFKPGMPIFSEQDIEIVKRSWHKLIDLGVKTVYPAHGKPFPVEKMKYIIGS
ncbi:MAG: MBL fold metallo-hydrolase [Calditrichaceae bacterium]|nr:MBL fold metallo-hydrolase [Calditrichaceae bacterium]